MIPTNKKAKGLSVKSAAAISGMSEQFIRIGLQREILPFGNAVKLSSKWTYYISPKRFYEYVGLKPERGEVEANGQTLTQPRV